MNRELIHYNGFDLINIQADSPDEFNFKEEELVRVEIPSEKLAYSRMVERGFVFGDRTIGVTINLKKNIIDYDRLIRFEMRKMSTNEERKAVLNIANKSFPADRRFHVFSEYNDLVAQKVIDKWVKNLNNTYLCIVKQDIVGFIDVEEISKDTCFIHLAAVEKKYRAAGVAMSMYAYAIKNALTEGYSKVEGRFSSMNTSVMNLYAFLGGSFHDARDVYLKEGAHND